MKQITSHANPLIKRLKSLHDKKHRQEEGLFLAEGMRVVLEALDAGAKVDTLLYAAPARDHAITRRLVAAAEAQGADVIETSEEILHKLTRKDNPQSVVGAFAARTTALEALDPRSSGLWIVLEAIKDPGNLGTILRLADCVGAGGVILLDQGCDPFSVEAVRASMGAVFVTPIAQTTGAAFFAWAAAAGGVIAGASLKPGQDYQAVRYTRPSFLLMGNEQSGLPNAYEARCTHLVRIPMAGKADSLNVAMATAVLAYEAFNQQRRG
jgi:RNA methyltransferase, TrmH family